MRLIAALLAVAVLALLNLAALASTAYTGFAERGLDRPPSPAALAAARIASRWAPWSSQSAALQGWLLAEARDAEGAVAAYRRALRLAPADPVLWNEYALARARLGLFDASLTLAVQRTQQLAPTSAAVRRSLADMGLNYWQWGTAEQRALWLVSMRAELAHSRGPFLGHALTRGRARTFCQGPAAELGEARWCEELGAVLRDGCFDLTSRRPASCADAAR